MKGLWTASEIENGAASVPRSAEENHLIMILSILNNHSEGLSNAELDASLKNSSQWVATWHLRELLAAAFIDYKVQLFGEPGKYTITDSGRSFLQHYREIRR